MSGDVGRKLDRHLKKELVSIDVKNVEKNVEKILKEDEAFGNDRKKSGMDNPVPLEDHPEYIPKDEDNLFVMINGSF